MILKTLALLVVLSMSCLSADTGLDSGSRAPKDEFQELAVILTKYGNNPKSMPVLLMLFL